MRIGRGGYGLAVAALLALAAYRPAETVIVVDGKPSDPGSMPECPHSWTVRQAGAGMLWASSRTDVPEFHDCQQLRNWNPMSRREHYGALAAVFAADSLEKVADSTLDRPRGRGGRGGQVLALVYLPRGGEYSPLGLGLLPLKHKFACVIVRRGATSGNAWIVPVDDGRRCVGPAVLTATSPTNSYELHVLEPPPSMSSPQIPPVARWDWDSTTHTQYIGVRCGGKWCEIGVRGFKSSPDHDPGTGVSVGRAGYAHRGAYDEQRLAEFPGSVPAPAMNLGTVVPMPKLELLTRQRPTVGDWIPVARTHLFPGVGTYEATFNFARTPTVTPAEARASTISLCIATETVPCTANERNTVLDVRRCDPDAEEARWIARVDRPGARSKYFCVLYREHEPKFYVPPVVRWRWRSDDETIWISCPSGCCEVNATM